LTPTASAERARIASAQGRDFIKMKKIQPGQSVSVRVTAVEVPRLSMTRASSSMGKFGIS